MFHSITFKLYAEFDRMPPTTISIDEDGLQVPTSSLVFVDETEVSRWAAPLATETFVSQLLRTLSPQGLQHDTVLTDYNEKSDPLSSTAHNPQPHLTTSLLRQQQKEWFRNQRIERKTKAKRRRNPSLSSNRVSDVRSSSSTSTMTTQQMHPSSTELVEPTTAVSESNDKDVCVPCDNHIVDVDDDIEEDDMNELDASMERRCVLPRLQKTANIEDNSDDVSAVTDIAGPSTKIFAESLAAKLVDVLSYFSTIMRAVNVGNAVQLKDILDRIMTPDGILYISTYPGSPPDKIVPRNMIVAFFMALLEAAPDLVYRIEDTKLLRGLPRAVSSTFFETGNKLYTIHTAGRLSS